MLKMVGLLDYADAHRAPRVSDGKTGAREDEATAYFTAMPESDCAYPIISGILAVVPASRWTYAKLGASADLVSLFGSYANDEEAARLTNEFKRNGTKAPNGPRIAAIHGGLDKFSSGVTLMFADARANFGILTLMRMPDLGPFTSSEIGMLTFALDALSERLSGLRLQPPSKQHAQDDNHVEKESKLAPPEGQFYVLNRDLQIVLAWSSEDQRRVTLTGLRANIAERLPLVLEETVRALTASWSDTSAKEPGVARPVPFLVVRTQPMSGPAGLFIGVRVDRFHPTNSLTGAASRFHISPREVQVLALLLDGRHLHQIAKELCVTSSTVQDHIKSMLEKTNSGNRSELIARVLGWESPPSDLGMTS